MIWERAAQKLTKKQVQVVFTALPPGITGLYDKDINGLVVVVDAGLEPAEKLWVFLHEVAHIKLGHADKLPALTNGRLRVLPRAAAAAVADPTYKDTKDERIAEGLANFWQEQINDVSWRGGWNPELKLETWLKGL